jgi:hypothetical protein
MSTKDEIAAVLDSEGRGMTVADVVERMTAGTPERRIRNGLNSLVTEGVVVVVRGAAAGRGAPPLRYYHQRHLERQLQMTDMVPGMQRLDVHPRAGIEANELVYPDEVERQLRTRSAMEEIAHGHLSRDRVAGLIVRAAPQLAAEDPVELVLGMAEWMVNDINETGTALRRAQSANDLPRKLEMARSLELKLETATRLLAVYYRLDPPTTYSQGVLHLPNRPRAYLDHQPAEASLDVPEARDALKRRIFGTSFIQAYEPGQGHVFAAATDASVADIFLNMSVAASFRPIR